MSKKKSQTPVEDAEQKSRREAREQTEVSREAFLDEVQDHTVFAPNDVEHEGYSGPDLRIPDPRNL